jgi:hypothetical protein
MFRLIESVASIEILQKDNTTSDFKSRNSATKVRGYEEMMINTERIVLNRMNDDDLDFEKELEEEKFEEGGIMNTTFESESDLMCIEEEEEMFMDAQEEIIMVSSSL